MFNPYQSFFNKLFTDTLSKSLEHLGEYSNNFFVNHYVHIVKLEPRPFFPAPTYDFIYRRRNRLVLDQFRAFPCIGRDTNMLGGGRATI